MRLIAVDAERAGQRIDNFLFNQLKGVPKSVIYRILRTGQVRINGKRAKPDTRIAAADQIRIPPIRLPEKAELGTPQPGHLAQVERAIIYEDRDFLVLNKPSGIASHGGSGVSFGAIELLRASRPRENLELVHRLDRDTSGVLVFARRRSALTALQSAIREGDVIKRYLALLEGHLPQQSLSVNAALKKSVLQGGERMVQVAPDGKPSLSHVRVLEEYASCTLVEVKLETGRTHQIRVHCQHIGHPVAGDDKYGSREFNRAIRDIGLKRLFLHAAHFEFQLPNNDQSYAFHAPLPEDLVSVLNLMQA